jgi:esterase/lipase superfamily enzyme
MAAPRAPESTPPAAAGEPIPPADDRVFATEPRATAPASPSATAQPALAPSPEFKVVKVYYGTNRQPLDVILYRLADWRLFLPMLAVGSVTMLLSSVAFAMARFPLKALLSVAGLVATLLLGFPALQQANVAEVKAGERPGPIYGANAGHFVELGVCQVSIPATHRYGQLESPSVFRLEFDEDPRRHIVVRSVTRLEPDGYFHEIRQGLAERGPNVLVFVHGYNVSFDDAARRTAQMAEDLAFPGVPLFFSWPSQNNWYEYRSDEKQVELAVPRLREFLRDVAHRSGAKSIHLVAHSMGSRALATALREMAGEIQDSTRFNQVILAAPDIDADVFRERIAPAIKSTAQRITLYASSNDLALVASRVFNSGDPRAGDSNRELLIVDGIETIDVSQVDTSLLGHSYYGNNPTVLTDLRELLLHTRPADQRTGLEPIGVAPQRYWSLRRVATAVRPEHAATPQ